MTPPEPEFSRRFSAVQAVDRSLEALQYLADGERSVTEVGARLGVDKSTASRLLGTLQGRGFVGRNPLSGKYRLGPQLAALGQAYLDNIRPRRDFGPVLEKLSDATGETVLLTVFDGNNAVYVDKVESRQPLRTHSRIGQRARFHCGASGKCIAAFLPREEAERLLGPGPLERFTERTITDREALFAEFEKIRRQGYTVSVEEIDQGVVGIGVPLLGWDGRPIGSISLTGPVSRLPESRFSDIVAVLREQTEEQNLEVLRGRGRPGELTHNGTSRS